MNLTIRPETDSDIPAIRQVNLAAFDSDAEANLVDALRDDGCVVASLVAELEGRIAGHILFSRLPIITRADTIAVASLAPMAVLPTHQRQGIGSRLVRAGLDICRQHGCKIAVVLGHPDYYPRFGFSAQLARPLQNPFGGGDAWMALEFLPGALANITGRVEYPPPFAELG